MLRIEEEITPEPVVEQKIELKRPIPRPSPRAKYPNLDESFAAFDEKGNRIIEQVIKVGNHLIYHGDVLLGTDDAATYSFNYAHPDNGDHTLRVQATDQSGKVAWASATVAVRDVLAGEVIQIDDEADIGDGINQITYSDGWTLAPGNDNDPRFNNNDHYSGNRDDWFEVKFSGAKIDVYATVASHHGTATAQIEGVAEIFDRLRLCGGKSQVVAHN